MSTPPQNRQLIDRPFVWQFQVDGFVGKLAFWTPSIRTLCEIKTLAGVRGASGERGGGSALCAGDLRQGPGNVILEMQVVLTTQVVLKRVWVVLIFFKLFSTELFFLKTFGVVSFLLWSGQLASNTVLPIWSALRTPTGFRGRPVKNHLLVPTVGNTVAM